MGKNTNIDECVKGATLAFFGANDALNELLVNCVEGLEEHPAEVDEAEDALTTACEKLRDAAFILWLEQKGLSFTLVPGEYNEARAKAGVEFDCWLEAEQEKWEENDDEK